MGNFLQNILKNIQLKPLKEVTLPGKLYSKTSFSQLRSPGFLLIALLEIFTISYFAIYFLGGGLWAILRNAGTDSSVLGMPTQELLGYNPVWQQLGISLGLLTIAHMALNFVLTTKWRWVENLFGGQDKAYKVHNLIGRFTLIIAILHPTVLITAALGNWELIGLYITPGAYLPYSFGSLALSTLILLIVLTIAVKMPYQWWLRTHRFMGVPLLLAGIHAFLINPEYQTPWNARTPFLLIWVLGMGAYIYSIFLFRYLGPRVKGVLKQIKLTEGVIELIVDLTRPIRVLPGQFMLLEVPASAAIPKESHPFSISGVAEGKYLDSTKQVRFSIKALGDFTAKLSNLLPGAEIKLQGPFGKFGERYLNGKKDMIWIAGGIGVTPFLSMLGHEAQAPSNKIIDFYWSVKTASEATYQAEIEAKAVQINQAHVGQFNYRQHIADTSNFLTAQIIADHLGGTENFRNRTIYICGPAMMMHALAEQFQNLGVRPSQIVFEEFAFN